MWFPSTQNPLVGNNEVNGIAGEAKAQVRTNVIPGETYRYCVLVWKNGRAHHV
jgi:hypothetical protein